MEHNNELAERKRQMELKHLEEQFNPHLCLMCWKRCDTKS